MPENENDVEKDGTTCRTCSSPNNQARTQEDQEADVSNVWRSPRAIKNWIGGGLLIAGLLLHYGLTAYNQTILVWQGTNFFVSDITFLVSIAVAGNVIIKNGYRALKKLNLSIDLLMTSAILGSIIASIFGGKHIFMEGATLAFLYNFAELLEDYSIEKARGSLRELKDLSPDT
ncbi:MAG: cation-transporting P-type ATPase, partial [Candidatus Bipolaricaulia bacterium]